MNFVKSVNFAGGHVFPFSKREGTPAAKMSNQLTKEEKHIRVKKLIKVFDELEDDYYKSNIGKMVIVIPEIYKDGILTGHTDNYLKVSFEGSENLIGMEVSVLLNKYENKVIYGTLNKIKENL